MGGLNSAQKKFLIILTIVTVISIVLTVLAYQLVPSLRTQTATNDPAGTPTATTITDTPTPTPTPHKKPTPTPTPVRPTPTPTPKPPVTIVITIQNSGYTPKTVTVPPGSTLIFKNKSSLDHTVTQTNGTKFDSKNIPAMTGTYTLKLTRPGTYQYDCTYHPFMVGTIIVQ